MKTTSLRQYLVFQLATAIQNTSEISGDADIEFLHKFRVAIRRSRSLLKLFHPDAYAFNAVLKEIVQTTNELRELDVFLASLDQITYPTLFNEIEKYRQKRFKAIWSEPFIQTTVKKLYQLHDEIQMLDLPYRKKELIASTEKYYSESLETFHDLRKDTSNEALHELRIKFKISRYALEFLNSCNLRDKHKKIKECKQIQDHLGEIQDAANQLDWLKHFCDEHPCKECNKLIKERKQYLKLLKKHM